MEVPHGLSKKETQTKSDLADKIERLIDEAKKGKAAADPSKIREAEKRPTAQGEKAEGEAPTSKKALREEILVTLTETSKELSRIIGVLLDEKEAPPTEPQILPRYCCYCGRDLLPNALYCDRCGAGVKGA